MWGQTAVINADGMLRNALAATLKVAEAAAEVNVGGTVWLDLWVKGKRARE